MAAAALAQVGSGAYERGATFARRAIDRGCVGE
jgi:hypothetical protein